MATDKNPLIQILTWIIYIVLFAGAIPLLALFFGSGIESRDFFDLTTLYYSTLVIFLIGVLFLFLARMLKLPFGWAVLHSPKQGFLYKVEGFKWIANPLKYAFVSIIVIVIMGLVGSFANTVWVGVPDFPQQISEATKIAFGVYPSSPSETTTELFILFLGASVVFYFSRKYKWSRATTILLLVFPVAIIRSLFGVAIHFARYGSSETKLLGVFIQRMINSEITFATGSVIYEYLWHDLINFFVKLNEFFANEAILIGTLIFLGIFMVTGISIWVATARRSRG